MTQYESTVNKKQQKRYKKLFRKNAYSKGDHSLFTGDFLVFRYRFNGNRQMLKAVNFKQRLESIKDSFGTLNFIDSLGKTVFAYGQL